MERNSHQNRRARSRVKFKGDIEVLVKGRPIRMEDCRNISLKGLFAVTETKIPLGTPCQVIIRLGVAVENMTLTIDAAVAREEADGLGVEFLEMDPDTFFHLRNIVLYNAEDADAIETEFQKPGFK